MKYIFISLLFDSKNEKEYLDQIGHLPMSVQLFQQRVIEGFKNNYVEDLVVFNTLPFPSFPKFGGLRVKTDYFHIFDYCCKTISYCNMPIIKNRSKEKHLAKELQNEIDSNEPITIVVYSLYIPYLKACLTIKKHFPHVHLHLIVPDLPYPYSPKSKDFKVRLIDRFYEYKSISFAKKFDSYTFLTKQMADVFNVPIKKYCVVEGICKTEPIHIYKNNFKKIIFLYSGTLRKWSGILEFIDAFCSLNMQNLELQICGKGECSSTIKDIASKDHRVKYLGFKKNFEILELAKNASFLINPRQNIGEYIKYSFPSKTMDYLSYGKPILMYKLDGIPNEYDSYLNYLDSDLKQSLLHYLSEDYSLLLEKARCGQRFVIEEKNPKTQIEKLIEVINRNHE